MLAEASAPRHSLYGTHSDGGVSLSICMFIVAKAKVNNKLCLKLVLDITQVTSITNPCVHFSKRASQSKSDFSVWGNVSPPPRGKAHISAW